MTNPSNAVGTNAAYAGRTSANAFNDDLAPYSRGVLSGWGCVPSSGLTVALGGDGSTRDVAVAEDNAGNKTTINNISGAPIEVTMGAAPGANSRIDAIVAYVDNPPQGSATIADNYEACGLIPVSGTAAASPTAPTDNQIRSAITADGASGTTAYYVVLATVTIPSGTTDITSDNIANGAFATLSSDNIDFATLPTVLSGTTPTKLCGGGGSTDFEVTLSPALADANYTVVATLRGGGAGWGDGFMWKIVYKETNYFTIQVWNPHSASITGVSFDWVLVKQP